MRDAPLDIPPAAIGIPIRPLDPPIPVKVWVSFPRTGFVQVDGRATAYSPRAGRVEFIDEHGRNGAVWVWATAIQRR
ncbi:Transposase [Occultella aeris]|uniref:Uncharacterized protein n=1 Tax=Occultella aeris TaxID=2761496 RepID=A0A7M4DHU4_9MICO|nr:hypothetical protein HALOF300_01695 [Occultella aeris]